MEKEILEKLRDIERLVKRSTMKSSLNTTGMAGICAGMALVVANPEYAGSGLTIFVLGCLMSIMSSWLG